MTSWRINAVRLPLNESCWLGLDPVKPRYRGAAYRSAVAAYVRRLTAAGLYVVLDLHWNVDGQELMPDAAHTPAFWRSVARAFRANRAVLFDLYNEPHDVGWACWRRGCDRWTGMQQLVDAVRSTGATQPILVGGLGWAGDLSGWLRYRPRGSGLVASVHKYNFGDCADRACWDAVIAPVVARVPVVTGELGENDCAHGFVDAYMAWADAHGVSYLGWTWNPWNCNDGPALISDWNGTPTPFGVGLRDHLQARKH